MPYLDLKINIVNKNKYPRKKQIPQQMKLKQYWKLIYINNFKKIENFGRK